MREAELLFSEILGCNRLSLYLDRNRMLNKDQARSVSCALKRRINGEPLQYIIAKQEFMGLEFKVTADVLIPRPETEVLVETTVRYSSELGGRRSKLNILDLGTGSGCIAVSLAKLLSEAKITAVDISEDALNLAQENAQLNCVAERIKFIKSDLFDSHDLRPMTYDLIISNPPYIAREEIKYLQAEIQYEPRIALDGGKDGLEFYLRIIKEVPDYLKIGGLLAMEMGFGQKDAIEDIFQSANNFEIMDIVKDYNDIDRVIVAKLRNNI